MSVPRRHRRFLTSTITAAVGGLVASMLAVAPPVAGASPDYDPDAAWDASPTPYLGWSSWSMQATRADGTNPRGSYSWLTEENLLAQVDYMAENLKDHGYEYINLDAGWWRTWNWTPTYDDHGRPAVEDQERLPSGMRRIVDYIHSKGLKVGIYMPAGMEAGDEGDNAEPIDLTQTVKGAPECTLAEALLPVDPTTGEPPRTNFWQSSYALDFADTSDDCAQAYIDSVVELFESWGGVDLLKIDGVSPGSGRSDVSGENARYDNRSDIEAYDRAFQATGRHVEIQVSWAIDQDSIADFEPTSDSWRTDWDVECYCSTLTNWGAASNRLATTLDWAEHAGPHTGWNNLDSVIAGPNPTSGLTDVERRSVMSIWSLASSPLYMGDDLRDLDAFGLSLITNRDVLAVDQDPRAATLASVSSSGSEEVVSRQLADGSIVVGMLNLGSTTTQMGTTVADAAAAAGLDLRRRRAYAVKNLWSGETFQTTARLSAPIPAHGSALYRISPDPGAVQENPSAVIDLDVDGTTYRPGEETAVRATVTNTSAIAITDVSVSLEASGWDVDRVAGGDKKALLPGSSTTTTFTAIAPSSGHDPISEELSAAATFTGHGVTRTTSATVALVRHNLSLGKTAGQSSVDYGGVPERAVDGDTNGSWGGDSIAHTRGEPQSWWQVDLGSVEQIETIALWNRGDCCAERLSNYYVLVSDQPFTSESLEGALAQPGVWSQHLAESAGRPTHVDVGRTGRYVRVQLAGDEPLALAELQVF